MPWPYRHTGSDTAGPRPGSGSTVARITSQQTRKKSNTQVSGQVAAKAPSRKRYATSGLEAGQTNAGMFSGATTGPESAAKSGRPRQISLPRPSGISNLLSACERGRYMRNWYGSGPAPAARMLRASAFQGSGPTRWVWLLRRDAETGRMSVPFLSSESSSSLQTNFSTAIQPLPPSSPTTKPNLHNQSTQEHPMLFPQLWQR